MKNGDKQAMPGKEYVKTGMHSGQVVNNPGMTKREYFAAMAMQGLCADPHRPPVYDIAKLAVKMADALLAELESGL